MALERKDRLDRADFENLVVECGDRIRSQFLDVFQSDVQATISGLDQAYRAILDFESRVERDVRAAWVDAFLFNALDSVGTSTKLLLMGLLVPAGNLMRQFGESCAMALLCAHGGLGVVERLESEGARFPMHKAVHMISRKNARSRLNLDAKGWATFEEITKWYDRFSHTSVLALGFLISFSQPNTYLLGGAFDPDKIDQYGKELGLRASASQVLADVSSHLVPLVQGAQEEGLIERDFT